MRTAHLEALNFLAAQRAETLRIVRDISQSQFDSAPLGGGWSPGEVVCHLLIAENKIRSQFALLAQLHAAGDRPDVSWEFSSNPTVPAWIPDPLVPALALPFEMFNMFLPRQVADYMIRIPLFRFRAAMWAAPQKGTGADDLRSRLKSSFEQTRAVILTNSQCPWEECVVRHPSLGVNNVPQLLRFMGNHEYRHQGQIQRALDVVR